MGPGYGQQFLNQHSVSAARTPVFDFLGKKMWKNANNSQCKTLEEIFHFGGGAPGPSPWGLNPPGT